MAYAVNPHGCNGNLRAGATDGGWKKAAPHRGGVVEDTFTEARTLMAGVWHGFNESPEKTMPDGMEVRTPYYMDVACRNGDAYI